MDFFLQTSLVMYCRETEKERTSKGRAIGRKMSELVRCDERKRKEAKRNETKAKDGGLKRGCGQKVGGVVGLAVGRSKYARNGARRSTYTRVEDNNKEGKRRERLGCLSEILDCGGDTDMDDALERR